MKQGTVVRPNYCDDQRCRHVARWEFPSVTIRHPGAEWRPYRLCDSHAGDVTLQRRQVSS